VTLHPTLHIAFVPNLKSQKKGKHIQPFGKKTRIKPCEADFQAQYVSFPGTMLTLSFQIEGYLFINVIIVR